MPRKEFYFFIWFFLVPAMSFNQESGNATYYHDKFHGRTTSSGEGFSQYDFTAAHRTLPFGTIVSVTNKLNGKNAIVRINDRGPFKKSRIIDVSKSAASKLNMLTFGVIPVRIHKLTLLDMLPLNDRSLRQNDVWNIFGEKKSLELPAIYVWQTADLRHALYMASAICSEHLLKETLIKVHGTAGTKRTYRIFIPFPEAKKTADSLVVVLQREGYKASKIIYSN